MNTEHNNEIINYKTDKTKCYAIETHMDSNYLVW